MPPKVKANTDEEIFDQTAAPEIDPVEAAEKHNDQTIGAPVSGAPNGDDLPPPRLSDLLDDPTQQASTSSIDFEELARRNREAREMHNMPDDDSEVGDGDFFINMAKADEKLKPMAIGTRLVVSCTGAEAKISGSGNPMIAVRVKAERVVSTPDASTDTRAYKNRTVRDNLLFIPPNDETGYRGTIWRANAAMRAFGVEPDHGIYRKKSEFLAMLQRKAEELVGAVCEIEVGIDDGTKGGTQPPELDPATGEPYPPKNTIARYYAYKPTPVAVSDDSDLPF